MTNPSIPPCPKCGKAPMLVPPSLPKLPTIKRYLNVDCECVIRALGQLVSLSDWTKGVNATLGRACRELGIETVEQLKTRLAPDPRVAVLEDGIRVALQMCGYKKVGEIESANRYETLDALGLLTQLIAAQRGEGER